MALDRFSKLHDHIVFFFQFYYHTKQLHSKICHVSDQVDAMFERDNWERCDGTPIEARHLANVLRVSTDD